MWELKLEDAEFPIQHSVYLYVTHEDTNLTGGYMSVDLATNKNITEVQLFNYPIGKLNKVRLLECIDLLTKSKYVMLKKEKDYSVNQNLLKIQEDF
jgi:hypothetical protein